VSNTDFKVSKVIVGSQM